MCGIVGIVGQSEVATQIYEGLTVLQHRGQDAAGMATSNGSKLVTRRKNGLVRDVFSQEDMFQLRGTLGIGHCRYPTAGQDSGEEVQPLYVNSPFGIALAHNGNLVNTTQLQRELYESDRRHLNTESDSEALLNVLAHELQLQPPMQLNTDQLFRAVAATHRRLNGGYAAVALFPGYGLLAFRDPHGIRPLVFGVRETAQGKEYAVASESVVLDTLGFDLVRDVAPGEAVYITMDGQFYAQQCAENPQLNPCIFEHVYFARPDSMMDDISVYKARLRMGDFLAQRILRDWPDHDIDAVIPVPDTSRNAATPLLTAWE